MIRHASHSDLEFLVDGLKKLVEHIQMTSQDTYFLDLENEYHTGFEPWLKRLLADRRSVIFIADQEQQPVGFIVGQLKSPFLPFSLIKQIGEILICWVEAPWRRRGIAGQLTQALETWFSQHGVDYVELQYIVGNTEAENFWGKWHYNPYRITTRKNL